jgi:hypothetical protein
MKANWLFTKDQYIRVLKDKAIFGDTLHMRKQAVLELVRRCDDIQSASAIVSELIESCPNVGDQDFKEFCEALMRNIRER